MHDPQTSCWPWRPAQPGRIERQASLIRLEGPDALRFLHGQSSQAIESAAPGAALATCLISPTARMRALARVLVDGSGAWLLIEAGDAEAVRRDLDRVLFPADRVELGPVEPALLITPVPGDGTGVQASWQTLQSSEAELWQLGQQLVIRGAETAPTAHPLAARPLLPPQEQQRWRIQQGWPEAPGELNDDTNPFELGLAARVSLSKGCYVGQETLAKLATYDGVKQQLRRWCSASDGSLSPGQTLRTASGERAGTITSVLDLTQAGGSPLWLGLALVRRQALEQPWLLAGETDTAPRLAISRPDEFVDPPVGTAQR